MVWTILSETFWTALGAIGTLIGSVGAIAALYFIYRQIKSTKEIAAYEFLRRENDRFRLSEMRRHRSDVARALLLNADDVTGIAENAEYVLDFFEDLGLLRKKGLAPDYFIWTMNSYLVLRYWPVLKHYVDVVRDSRGDLTYYNEFESLYSCMLAYEKKERHIEDITFTPEDRREFLQDELGLSIRSVRLSDLNPILEIEGTSFPRDAYSRSRFERLYNNHPEGFVVADVLGEVVAYAVGYLSHGVGEIDSLAVDSRYRRLGIARALLERLLDGFLDAGAKTCSLEVRTTNESAIRLYQTIGFTVVDTLQAYYADRGSAFVMEAMIGQGDEGP